MLEEILGIFYKLWRHKSWRPHLINAGLTLGISIIAFFYINAKHDEALAAIYSQQSAQERIFTSLEHIGNRVDELYRLVASRVR